MEKADRGKVLADICSMCEPFALGWRAQRVEKRIRDIEQWLAHARAVPLKRRRSIARKAKNLLDELHELGSGVLNKSTLRDLEMLAESMSPIPDPRRENCNEEIVCAAQGAGKRPGRGGDRRSGQHSADVFVCRMIVRLYIEATAKPGFSLGGPLPRFVSTVCALLRLARPTDEAIRKIFQEIQPLVRKIDASHWYN